MLLQYALDGCISAVYPQHSFFSSLQRPVAMALSVKGDGT